MPPCTHLAIGRRAAVPAPQVWVRVFDQCMLGMIMFHIIMVGILGIKKSIGAPIFVLILLAFDFVFWCVRAEAVCARGFGEVGGACLLACPLFPHCIAVAVHTSEGEEPAVLHAVGPTAASQGPPSPPLGIHLPPKQPLPAGWRPTHASGAPRSASPSSLPPTWTPRRRQPPRCGSGRLAMPCLPAESAGAPTPLLAA